MSDAGCQAKPVEHRSGFTNIDVFAAANTGLFASMCAFRYFNRFVAYRGAGNLHEFFIYAVAIMAVIGLLWRHFRKVSVPSWLLWGLQAGIVMHFAGGFVTLDGRRLYDVYLFGLPHQEYFRYDKLVHLVNAFIAALVVGRPQISAGGSLWPRHLLC